MMRLDAPALIADAAPVPKPGRGEILVRIFAAGVTPTELLWYPTTHTREVQNDQAQYPDMSSPEIIEAVGSEVESDQIGHKAYILFSMSCR